MSDVLLTEISKKLSDIHTALTGSKGAVGGATPPKTTAATGGAAPDAAAKAKADAAAKAAAKAKADAAAKAKAGNGPATGTKAPGGKYTIDQVREVIRKVASTDGLGRESATNILNDDGGGVSKVIELKPENYDAVYEACTVLLNSEGGAPAAEPEDDLM